MVCHLIDQGEKLDAITLGCLVELYGNVQNKEMLHRVVEVIDMSRLVFELSSPSFPFRLASCSHSRVDGRYDRIMFATLISNFGKVKEIEQCIKYWNQMKESNIPPNKIVYHSMLMAHGLVSRRSAPSLPFISCALITFLSAGGRLERHRKIAAGDAHERAEEQHVTHRLHVLYYCGLSREERPSNAGLQRRKCRAGSFELALRQPRSRFVNLLLRAPFFHLHFSRLTARMSSAATKAGDDAKVWDLFSLMLKKNSSNDSIPKSTLNHLISYYAARSNFSAVEKVFEVFKKQKGLAN